MRRTDTYGTPIPCSPASLVQQPRWTTCSSSFQSTSERLVRPSTSSSLPRVAFTHHPSFYPDQALPSLVFLSLATISSFYPLLLLPLLILLILQPSQPTSPYASSSSSSSPEAPLLPLKTKALKLAGTYVVMLGSLLVGARAMLGGWERVFKGWKVILGIVDLTPNVGLSWYFFTEMFDHFRPFFTMVFQVSLRL